MSMAVATLKKGEGRTLKAGGAWIFDNEIESVMGSAENGDIVLVHDFRRVSAWKGIHKLQFKNPDSDDDAEYRSGDRP